MHEICCNKGHLESRLIITEPSPKENPVGGVRVTSHVALLANQIPFVWKGPSERVLDGYTCLDPLKFACSTFTTDLNSSCVDQPLVIHF